MSICDLRLRCFKAMVVCICDLPYILKCKNWRALYSVDSFVVYTFVAEHDETIRSHSEVGGG